MPKRNARRAVTRSLLKRQMRNAALRRIDALASAEETVADETAALRAGLWVVRLRAPFDRSKYPSAASDALRSAARAELDAVLRRAARKALSPGAVRAGGAR